MWIEKQVFVKLIRLYLKKKTPKNAIRSIELCPCHASRNLVLATLVLFRNVSLSVCLRLSDEKFRENNVLACPAGYSYYNTNHNDGVEDYFNHRRPKLTIREIDRINDLGKRMNDLCKRMSDLCKRIEWDVTT